MDGLREGFEAMTRAITGLTQALTPVTRAMQEMFSSAELVPRCVDLTPDQVGRPVRLGGLRSRLRELGVTEVTEPGVRGMLAYRRGVTVLLVLRCSLAEDVERWALHVAALARVDPEPDQQVAALSAILEAGGLVVSTGAP